MTYFALFLSLSFPSPPPLISSSPPFSFHPSTVSYWVTGCWGAASPSVMLLDLWFPVKHNESYIRLFWVRWWTICSRPEKQGQQKATATLVFSRIFIFTQWEREADNSDFRPGKILCSSQSPNQFDIKALLKSFDTLVHSWNGIDLNLFAFVVLG